MSPYTQDAATLYPGLCASALTVRAGQCVFGEQVVRVNQEQFHFGYIKLYTLPNKQGGSRRKLENGQAAFMHKTCKKQRLYKSL